MKGLESLNELYIKVNSQLGEIDAEISDSKKKIKKEINILITDEKLKLLKLISDGEKLNLNDLMQKYLDEKEKKTLNKDCVDILEIKNEDLLDTITIEGKTYFYENKEKGNVYDSKSKCIGVFKNGKITFN
jgi:hypothetical protein